MRDQRADVAARRLAAGKGDVGIDRQMVGGAARTVGDVHGRIDEGDVAAEDEAVEGESAG